MDDELTDNELLARVAAGDEHAFARLLAGHQQKIFALIYRYTHDRAAAEDLCQETFFKVWKYARTFQGRSAVATWLYRLAVNTCLNYRQQQKSRPVELPLFEDSQAAAATLDPELDRREELLHRALAALPERQRLALLLVNFSAHSYEQVAEIMGLSLGAVESLLFRARRRLAEILRPFKEKGEL